MGSILRPTKIEKKSQIFFINLCNAITDVIFLCVSMRFLDAIFLKKTFNSKRFRCDCHPCLKAQFLPSFSRLSAFLGSTRTEYPSLREKAVDISVQIFSDIIIYAKNIFI